VTLDDVEGQYCNMNCLGCSAFFLATAGLSCLDQTEDCRVLLVHWTEARRETIFPHNCVFRKLAVAAYNRQRHSMRSTVVLRIRTDGTRKFAWTRCSICYAVHRLLFFFCFYCWSVLRWNKAFHAIYNERWHENADHRHRHFYCVDCKIGNVRV